MSTSSQLYWMRGGITYHLSSNKNVQTYSGSPKSTICLHIFAVGGEVTCWLATSPPTKMCKQTLLLSHLNPPSPPLKRWSLVVHYTVKKQYIYQNNSVACCRQWSLLQNEAWNFRWLLTQYTIAQNIIYINMPSAFKGLKIRP